MDDKIRKIALGFAVENCSDAVYPAHLFKAVLHKDAGLVPFIESTLDKDYYYLQDWADVQMQLAPKAVRPMRDLELSPESGAVLDEASSYARKFEKDEEDLVCLLAALVTPGVGFSFEQLKTLPLSPSEICSEVGAGQDAASPYQEAARPSGRKSGGAGYLVDKVAESREGKHPVVIGFGKETDMICEILGRKYKANLLITGDAGVGKTSLLNAFFKRLADGDVPGFLKGSRALQLDLAALGADASYKGEINDRFKSAVDEVESVPGTILVIESIDKLFDKQGDMKGAADILKEEISKGKILLLCTSTIEGFTKHMETDKELTSKLEKFTVEEPSQDMTLEILKGALPAYEEFHKLSIEDAALEESIRLAKRYLTERSLPDSAFDLIDRAFSHLKTENGREGATMRGELKCEDLAAVIAARTGVPMGKVQTQERDRLLGGEETLKQRVVGQDLAVKKVLDAVFESRAGLSKKGQPMGSFFFLGPTGTGKTELSKALAAFLFGDESALIRFDMSEFKEEHSVALLYGAPPGYVGYEEGGLLVNKIRQNPYSVVLFDEIEKAHKSVFDLFLQILDEGKLHDRLGRVGDFSHSLILFTSNIGSQFIVDKFGKDEVPQSNELVEIMQQYFRPEYLARLSEIVPFAPISEHTVTRIFDIHLKGLVKLLDEQGVKLEMSEDVKTKIAMKDFSPQLGARPILGVIRKELRNPLSKMIIGGKVKVGDTVEVGFENGEATFKVK